MLHKLGLKTTSLKVKKKSGDVELERSEHTQRLYPAPHLCLRLTALHIQMDQAELWVIKKITFDESFGFVASILILVFIFFTLSSTMLWECNATVYWWSTLTFKS